MAAKLKDQIAIITGASSGIGAGTARMIATEGATVVINYPAPAAAEGAQTTLKAVEEAGGKGIVYQADVSKEEEVVKMFADVIERFGTVDILVNNAGLQRDSAFADMTLEQWNTVIGVNLTGQFLCAREAVKEFLRRGVQPERSKAAGKIICMSSVHQIIPWAGHANYAASKGGINMMMQSISQELAPAKIRINSVGPGAIKTPINHNAWATPDAERKLLQLIPYGRVGETDDIAKAVVWLATDESDYVNGVTLFVDGGMTLFPGFSTNG